MDAASSSLAAGEAEPEIIDVLIRVPNPSWADIDVALSVADFPAADAADAFLAIDARDAGSCSEGTPGFAAIAALGDLPQPPPLVALPRLNRPQARLACATSTPRTPERLPCERSTPWHSLLRTAIIQATLGREN
jgi:hypothetical protein